MMNVIDVLTLFEIQQKNPNIHLIDVREADEFEDSHAQGAVNFPLSSLNPEEVLNSMGIEKSQEIYFICASGGRSTVAASQFMKVGCTYVTNIEGGTYAWIASDLPLG